MKCEACNGTGKDYDWLPVQRCKVCNGTGFVETTNEEWLSLLSTKEKAKALSNAALKNHCDKVLWEKWLNERHDN